MTLEQLWAPWRLAYIKGSEKPAPQRELPLLPDADADCFLCRAAVDEDLRGNLVVARTANTLVILNRYPYNNGHLLVAPRKHTGRLDTLDTATLHECLAFIQRVIVIQERELSAQGFNIGLNLGRVAGAGVPGHLHWHIVPRWAADSNFMPVTAGTKVISQSLDALWDIMVAGFSASNTAG